jgi:nucleoside-diphosphate-sugar epimerase
MEEKTIAIVGGSGFIGKSLTMGLAKNFKIKIVDLKPLPDDLKSIATGEVCDITNYGQIVKALRDVDFVIHTAIIQIPLINDKKALGYQVNIVGTQNVCSAVEENSRIKGLILSGSWHTVGERDLGGLLDEEFGFRPDKVEERARLYALSKMAQEAIVRFYDEMSSKIYGIIRMGTVLGDGMPEKTAANIFIDKGLRGESLTPFKQSMYRPMLYANINDICQAYERFATKILNGEMPKNGNSLTHIVNVYYPEPITIIELAEMVKVSIEKFTKKAVTPKIDVVDNNMPVLFTKEDKNRIKVDISKATKLLGIEKMKSPEESVQEIVRQRINKAV